MELNKPKLNEFYESLNGIKSINSHLDKKREELKTIIEKFDKETQGIKIDKNLQSKNKEVGELLAKTIQNLKSTTSFWVSNFENLSEKEKFRSDLETYFIVIIYGKVKAGKSTLGNFIAKLNTSTSKAEFFKYDEVGKKSDTKELKEMIVEDEFATDNLECTKEIQGFKLGGLAWIDTPGLGSMVEENGNLARQYIQKADYIIYPTNSSAPFQEDENEQLEELLLQKKYVSICIAKSDEFEKRKDKEDKYIKDENGKIRSFLVNKTIENRKEQEDDIKDRMKKTLKNSEYKIGDVFSFSVMCAKEGIRENDEELYSKSNIEKLYEQMTDIVKNKSEKLKKEAPVNELVAFVENEILQNNQNNGCVKTLLDSFTCLDDEAKGVREKLEQTKENIVNKIEPEINNIVSMQEEKINKRNIQNELLLLDEKLDKSIQNIIADEIKKALDEFNTAFVFHMEKLTPKNDFKIEDTEKTIKETFVNNGFFRTLGVIIGFCDDNYETIERTVKIGDNKEDVMQEFKKTRIEFYGKKADGVFQNIEKEFLLPLFYIIAEMKNRVLIVEKEIKEYKENLKDIK